MLCRSRIGHTFVTHFMLKKDSPAQCEDSQCTLTVRHILVECDHLKPTRKEICGNIYVIEYFRFYPELILNFLKER